MFLGLPLVQGRHLASQWGLEALAGAITVARFDGDCPGSRGQDCLLLQEVLVLGLSFTETTGCAKLHFSVYLQLPGRRALQEKSILFTYNRSPWVCWEEPAGSLSWLPMLSPEM